jgi:hypothetical protein
MKITSALASPRALTMEIDGRSAYVEEPKLTLLAAGIVVLLADDDYWERATSAEYRAAGEPPVLIHGATTDPQVIALARRFADGETGDLLLQ